LSDYIHIVCLDAPSPPNYGGAIDMYYKLTSLAAVGKKIILHYFDYRKNRNAGLLENCCTEIHSYSRKSFIRSFSFSSPYIISSRINSSLIKRLNEDSHPILLEGLHCSGIIPFLNDKNRVVLRMHNEEVNYYKSLVATEKKIFKKNYFNLETALLKKYQKKLDKNLKTACLSQKDISVLQNEYGFTNLHFVPCFIPWQNIKSQVGKGHYCLYHGNMAVTENEAAAVWLLKNVFSQINIPFVIAGSGISKKLFSLALKYTNSRLVYNPPVDELNGLIKDAHINVLPSKNNTGVKLKLLHALFEGRFCITNTNGIEGSNIQSGVHIANSPQEFIQLIQHLYSKEFTMDKIAERKSVKDIYNNETNTQKLSALW